MPMLMPRVGENVPLETFPTLIFENYFLTLSRDSFACNLETGSDPSGSILFLLLNRSSSDKITLLVHSNSKIESGLDRCSLLINVVSVQAHSSFLPQNISSSEPRGLQALILAC